MPGVSANVADRNTTFVLRSVRLGITDKGTYPFFEVPFFCRNCFVKYCCDSLARSFGASLLSIVLVWDMSSPHPESPKAPTNATTRKQQNRRRKLTLCIEFPHEMNMRATIGAPK